MSKSVIVVGAGAWGGWTAFHLQKAGFQVTLVEKEGPGNVLSGSGGKTRIIRMAYGGSQVYTDLTAQSFNLWEAYSKEWNDPLYHEKGALWMFRGVKPTYAELSIPLMKEKGFNLDALDLKNLSVRYPEINLKDITSAYWEPKVAYLEASRACGVIADKFKEAGGQYLKAEVEGINYQEDNISGLTFKDGTVIQADEYVFACGPWLTKLVPEMKGLIHISRQEVYYFDALDQYSDLPIWLEFREGDQMYYGIPDHFGQGFKFAYDERRWSLDPDQDDRGIRDGILAKMRGILVNRFPSLKDSAVLKHHTCVYENSLDGDFIIDKLPKAQNGLVLAGSSGHGYKMGPAIGKLVTDHLTNQKAIPSEFLLQRFEKSSARKSQYEV
ncbi:FAD-binding oxidoreductase [Roseivirga sp. E12]|uniref:NAD(P)/FAD-dependent oxidoreductase n=1 Tax=Roseivirga sp. E12 TaxID=2819237 RepID=UPI001ABC3E51|nr:FAD-dependent oxidoreductase [Roseivirga sp. E12]MBO3698267.1 FAD-dependent oxidoreductase [Roseivirga sp. E12]